MAQENLYMLKRLNDRTSFYNVKKLNKDYKASQYYKKNHCLYPPIDFNKTFTSSFNKPIIYKRNKKSNLKKINFSKTKYTNLAKLTYSFLKKNKKRKNKRKKFEDFNYKDLYLDKMNMSDLNSHGTEKIFKKIYDNKDEIKNIIKGYKDKEIEKEKENIEENEQRKKIKKIEKMNTKRNNNFAYINEMKG